MVTRLAEAQTGVSRTARPQRGDDFRAVVASQAHHPRRGAL